MSIKQTFNWILSLFSSNTPACVLLGIEINSDKTCEDLRTAFDWVFFSTLLVVIMIMMYRLLKIMMTFVKILYFKYIMKYSHNISNKVCQSLMDEINVICDKHFYIWTKQTKAEVFEHFTKHKAKCPKCNNKLFFRNSIQKFFTQSNVNDKDLDGNELKIVFLNDKFNKKDVIYNNTQKKNERTIMKVNEWFAKQLQDYKEFEFERETRKRRRWCMKNNVVTIGNEGTKNGCNADGTNCSSDVKHKNDSQNNEESAITCSIEESSSVENDSNVDSRKSAKVKESSVDNENIRQEIASNIDEIQSVLSYNRSNFINCDKLTNSSSVSNKKRKRLMKRSSLIKRKQNNNSQDVLHLTPNKEYPLLLLEGAKQMKTILIGKPGSIKKKKWASNCTNKNMTSIALSDSYSSASSDTRRFCKNDRNQIKYVNIIPSDKNKNLFELNETEDAESLTSSRISKNATVLGLYQKLVTDKIRNVKKAIETEREKKKQNRENAVAHNKNECNNKGKSVTEATKKVIQRIDNKNRYSETPIHRREAMLREMNRIKGINDRSSSGNKFPCGTEDVNNDANNKLALQNKNSDETNVVGCPEVIPNSFSGDTYPSLSRYLNERYQKMYSKEKKKTFKEEVYYNVMNVPKEFRETVMNRYRVMKNMNVGKKHSSQTAIKRLGIIFENSPWAL